MDVDLAMKINFPEEIIVDILSRLPVRSLLRFKCASKFWKSLISEPYFKTKHWNHAKNSRKFLISQYHLIEQSQFLYCSSVSSVQQVEDVQELGHPSNDKQRHHVILCCCDGLALLWSYGDHHLLWNPSTNESVLLPDPEGPGALCSTFGLGYDSTSNDYKILKIDSMGHGSNLPNHILALKSGSWRNSDNHPRGFLNNLHAVDKLAFVRGAFHWITMDVLSEYFVVSFNISNEVYGEIPLPEGICDIWSWMNIIPARRGVSVLDGMLCAYCTYRDREAACTFKLWVMKEYGVKESWTHFFTIRETHIFTAIPIYRFADGEVLLYHDGDSRSTRGYRTSKGPYGVLPHVPTQVFCYTESLISPKLLT